MSTKRASGGLRHSRRPRRKPLTVALGKILHQIGLLSLPVGLGAVAGFYAADQGMRWLPTMLQSVLAVFVLGFAAMPLGRWMQGRASSGTARHRRLRKRVIACLLLATAGVGARLIVHWTQVPTALTSLSDSEFNRAFELDGRRYRELEQGMEGALALLEGRGDMFDSAAPRVLSADEEDLLLDAWRTLYEHALALDQLRIYYEDWYRFDPSRAERDRHVRSFLLTYAAELALYEKSTRLVQLISRNKNAVKFLDVPHPSHDLPADAFGRLRQELQGMRDQARVVAGEQYLRVLDKGLGAREEARALGCNWLWRRAERHIAVIDAISSIDKTKLTIGSDFQVLKRSFRRAWYPAQSKFAEWMGDTRVRRIGTYLITEAQLEEMDRHLEPGDILLSRKNWYLSNVGLPGFWPHAILYIGTPEAFDAYFDDPDVRRYVEGRGGAGMSLGRFIQGRRPSRWFEYRLGDGDASYRVIEAISEGVVLNTLEHAAGDYLAAIRPRLDKVAKARAIIEAFDHLDKPYDYNFDFATDHTLVCTELVWRSYRPGEGMPGLDLPLRKIMGRQTLPANDLVRRYADEYGDPSAQFDFVYFLDGREKDGKAIVSDEAAFRESQRRTKWDIALD